MVSCIYIYKYIQYIRIYTVVHSTSSMTLSNSLKLWDVGGYPTGGSSGTELVLPFRSNEKRGTEKKQNVRM